MIFAGLILMPIYYFSNNWIPVAILIFLASFFLSFAGPLNEAVYSDLIKRSGKYKDDLLGLSKANSSLAYIVTPVAVGILADNLSYSIVFSIIGTLTAIIGFILFVFAPKKLHLSISGLDDVESAH
jgi:MFS family permease